MAITLYGSKQNIIQVVQAVKTDTYSQTAAAWTDIPSLSLSITPSSASNKILLIAQVSVSNSGAGAYTYMQFRFTRNSTAVGISTVAQSNQRAITAQIQAVNGTETMQSGVMSYMDSPATTSATTYTIQYYNQQTLQTGYINRTGTDTNSTDFARAISTLTAFEVAYA